MINISNEQSAQKMVEAISAIYNQFGDKPFTRAQYNNFRNTRPTQSKHSRKGRMICTSTQPTLQTLVDAKIIIVVDAERFEKAYLSDSWGDREWIEAAELREARKVISGLSGTLGSLLTEQLDNNIETIDCQRYYYKLRFNNLGDYVRSEMPWITKLLIGGAF